MDRRQFLSTSLLATSALALHPFRAVAQTSSPSLQFNTDNDEEYLGRPDMPYADSVLGADNNYWPFEKVTSYLSPFLEQSFDIFVFVNTNQGSDANAFVPSQKMKIVRRTVPNTNLFNRDVGGRINALNPLTKDALIWKYIGVSTGIGSPHIFTYSGLFRLNTRLSKDRHFTSWDAYMSYSSYIDYVYNTGIEAHVAIHGTPHFSGARDNWALLGNHRASEGCCRVHPSEAVQINELFIYDESIWSDSLPKFDRNSPLPSQALMNGNVTAERGPKVLVVFFQGYDPNFI